MPTSIAMVLDIEISTIVKILGHDGSQIIYPNKPEPYNHVGFRLEEMQYVAWSFGKYLVKYTQDWIYKLPGEEGIPQELPKAYLPSILADNIGIITGLINGNYHCVAWDNYLIHDPNGSRYELERFTIYDFYALL